MASTQILNFNPTNFYYMKAPFMTTTNPTGRGIVISSATDYNITNIAVSTDIKTDTHSLYSQPDISFAFYSANTIPKIEENSSDKNAANDICSYISSLPATNTYGETNQIGDQYYNQALCKNYDLAQQIQQINVNSLGSNVLYKETKSLYSRELLMTANLCVGIVGSGVFIYFNR